MKTQQRTQQRTVLARDLEPGMVVRGEWRPVTGYAERVVARVVRAADVVDAAQAKVCKARSRPEMLAAAAELVELLGALVDYGREARLVWFVGQARAFKETSGDEFVYLRRASREEMA